MCRFLVRLREEIYHIRELINGSQVYKGKDEILLSKLILEPQHSVLRQSYDCRLRMVPFHHFSNPFLVFTNHLLNLETRTRGGRIMLMGLESDTTRALLLAQNPASSHPQSPPGIVSISSGSLPKRRPH